MASEAANVITPTAASAGCATVTRREAFLGAANERGLTRFRVWAPGASTVDVCVESPRPHRIALERTAEGYFAGESRLVQAGVLYKYSLDRQPAHPDPCSRFQPLGPHGASAIVDVSAHRWRDAAWPGATLRNQVIYEMHIGTFTPEGTFDAACARLEFLRDLGITMLELLPVAECPGRWNWGYDGVFLFAPFREYGDHDAMKRFVDCAHVLGLSVILDVVYNHLGPDGNYLKKYSAHYFSRRYRTDWGEAFNFDDELCVGARDFVIDNAKYWLREFHLDGFRLDATQSIFDASRPHVLAQLVTECRETAAPRTIVFIAENEPQHGEHLLPPEQGGFGLDAMWNDDFHHAIRVALTGSRDGYFHDYLGRSQELLSAIKHGFLYQGQYYHWQKQRRGSPLPHAPRAACVHFIQNHDQVGNTGIGERLHTLTSPPRYRAATALLLLGPQTPLLFMGQEFAASTRFMFFADHSPELNELVHRGRREFLTQFVAYATADVQLAVRNPSAERTFLESKLDWRDVERHAQAMALHRDLLAIRRDDRVIANQDDYDLDGATLTERAFILRWLAPDGDDRLLLVNLGGDAVLDPSPEPLLAPPLAHGWALQWSSESPRYGGSGVIAPVSKEGRWRIPSECAVLLQASQRP